MIISDHSNKAWYCRALDISANIFTNAVKKIPEGVAAIIPLILANEVIPSSPWDYKTLALFGAVNKFFLGTIMDSIPHDYPIPLTIPTLIAASTLAGSAAITVSSMFDPQLAPYVGLSFTGACLSLSSEMIHIAASKITGLIRSGILHSGTTKRMLNATTAALIQYQEKGFPYASIEQGLPTLFHFSDLIPSMKSFQTSYHSAAEQGNRAKMEDAHFIQSNELGTLGGVFDGHGGSDVAKFASEECQSCFFDLLSAQNGNILKTFHLLFERIQEKISIDHYGEWHWIGSTAVICFIDKMGWAYTATLGDSEAKLYRTIDNQLRVIPLSTIQNWTQPDDTERAINALSKRTNAFAMQQIKALWSQIPANDLRFPYLDRGLNVSRALGDVWIDRDYPGAISHLPSVTIQRLQEGDLLFIGCDGLWGFMEEEEITEQIKRHGPSNPDLAELLVKHTLLNKHNDQNGHDNITLMVLNC